jgi:DNA-binding beta-propeller fold protein YncE
MIVDFVKRLHRFRVGAVIVALSVLTAPGGASAQTVPVSSSATDAATLAQPVTVVGAGSQRRLAGLSRARLAEGARRGQLPLRIAGLDGAGDIDLTLEPFQVAGPRTQYVVGRVGQPDRPLTGFDPAGVTMLRSVDGVESGTRAFLAFDAQHVTGSIAVNGVRYRVASGSGDGALMLISPTGEHDPLPPGVPFCGANTLHPEADAGSPLPQAVDTGGPARGRKLVQVAIDTDYEFFVQAGGSTSAAAFYVTALYGAICDIYLRDLNIRLELTFVRLWDTPADLYNDPDPLIAFADQWENNMGAIERDAVQLLTGRRDLPYGGVAWLNGMCGSFQYSVAGLIRGAFGDPAVPGSHHWDILVAAHELGHTCGSAHTHDYGLDQCFPHPGVESRGTIMGYCHTQNGGVANMDLRFHSGVQEVIEPFIATRFCVDDDCNDNGVADAIDIAGGTSLDVDLDGVPDECADCDGDGIRDDLEIAGGAPDVDGDGIPDECQTDCNANNLPDSFEIAQGSTGDIDGDGVPDECMPDCDTNGVPDVVQIHADLDLDVDRDARLDACADCDADGVSDLEALAGAHAAWVVGRGTNIARGYHPDTGARWITSQGGTISDALDVIVAPNGNVLVASGSNWRVIAYDGATGALIGNFVGTGSGGMRYPAGLAFGPDGHLYVTSRDTDAVFKYDGATGAFLAQFVFSTSGGLDEPYGLAFGPNGNLFVASGATDQVLEYDGASGAFVGVYVSAGSGGLSQPRALTFKHDGNLLVASLGTGSILEYDRLTGDFVRTLNRDFSTVGADLNAWGVAIGPGGNVYITRHTGEHRVFEFDVLSGEYVQSYVRGPYAGLDEPTGIAFAPGFSTDCNANQIPDGCEVATGSAADANLDDIPDACQTDCDGNGTADWLEIAPRGSRLDCNFNGVLDDCELAAGALSAGLCSACPTPGDFDGDGDYDLLDAYRFTQCTGFDVRSDGVCHCANLDATDAFVTPADWALFEALLTGPS